MNEPRKQAGRPRTLDRAAALDAAMRLFWAQGYEGTSVADLTRAMGMTAPSIYEAFGDKEALFGKVLAHYQDIRDEAIRPILEGASAEEAIVAVITHSVEQVTRPGDPAGCLVSSANGPASPRNLAVRNATIAARERQVARLRDRLARDVEAGKISKEVDINGVARFAAATLQGISTQARDGVPRAELDAIAAISILAVRLALHPTH